MPKVGDFYIVGLEVLKNNDTPRFIISQLEKIDFDAKFQKQVLEVKLNLKNLDYKKLGHLLEDKEEGDNSLKFITLKDNKIVEINSKKKFSMNLSLLNVLKQIEGVEYVRKIN